MRRKRRGRPIVMTADEVFAAFVEKWVGKTARPRRGLERDLVALERQLGITLPASYVVFVLSYGICSTVWLLNSIVEGEHDVHDLAWFDDPRKMAADTALYESGGMPKGFLGFASDCGGNMFLFRKADCVPGTEDAPVFFFDHDFVTMEKIAPSFTEWLAEFVVIPIVPDDDCS